MRPEDRERIQIESASRAVERHVEHAGAEPRHYLEDLVNDTLYCEKQRLENERREDPRTRADAAFYHEIGKQLRHASLADLRLIIDEMARRFAAEIVGNFDERIYKLSTTVVPAGLSLLLSAAGPRHLLSPKALKTGISDHILLQGSVDHVRALLDHGTLVVVPTHSSHLDSIILGYAVHLTGMPPLLYGAGLNLFNNPLVSFFMNHLGAYRVDRKKRAVLYKDVLKQYATSALELGYHNLFFPGGTRSRSGAVERHLKRGLLGTGISAYVDNLRAGRTKPNVYIAPCTISYKLVLEAETLIGDHLKEVGKSQYIIDDDEFSRPRRVLNFLSNIVSLDGRIVLTFSEPLDVVGNRVDRDGHSVDPRGRLIDTERYVVRDGHAVHDEQRDAQYTNELSDAVSTAFLRDNVLMSTHLVGYVLFEYLKRKNPELDLYRLLRTGGSVPSVPVAELANETDRVLGAVRGLPGGPRLGEDLRQGDVLAIIADALRYFGTYHTQPAAVRRGDRIFHQDRGLLYYYGNRLRGYELGRKLQEQRGAAA
jgi:glycerol-3-phosphate O-acyltransferase